jgi:hypothetical protein
MSRPEAERDGGGHGRPTGSRATAVRHLVLGFLLMLTILFTAALCSLPR